MTIDEAYQLLGLTAASTENERFSVYDDTRNRLEGKLAKAPTPGLKEKYRESLRQMEEAIEVIEGTLDGGDLPTTAPSVDPQIETPATEAPAPQTVDIPRPRPSGRKSKSPELIIMAVVVVIVAIGGGWFLLSQQSAKAEQAAIENFMLNVNRGRTEQVELALNSSLPLDVAQVDEYGFSALSNATDAGHVDVVELLLGEPGINPNITETADDIAPIEFAAQRESTAVLHAYIRSPRVSVNKISLLSSAAYKGDLETVELLLARPDIDVNRTDEVGEAALGRASSIGHAQIVQELLAHPDIDVNLVDRAFGQTALFAASLRGQEQIVRLLLAHPEIDINRTDNNGLSALGSVKRKILTQEAAYGRGHPNYIENLEHILGLLREAGATE